jgi:DNA-binding CsgD family transcriptional regulator
MSVLDVNKIPSVAHKGIIEKVISRNFIGHQGIDHFSINLMLDNKMIVLSSNLNLVMSFQKSKLEPHYLAYSPEIYKRLPVYAWEDCFVGQHGRKVRDMIINKNGLHNGTMVIRNMGSFFIMYSIATTNRNPLYRSHFYNIADEILKAGDFAYNELKETFMNYSELELHSVTNFKSVSDTMAELSLDHTENPLLKLATEEAYHLTPKEIESLYWARQGKSAEETAFILGRSIERIKSHLKAVREKMVCKTISQAIAEAINSNIFK